MFHLLLIFVEQHILHNLVDKGHKLIKYNRRIFLHHRKEGLHNFHSNSNMSKHSPYLNKTEFEFMFEGQFFHHMHYS